jgi:hypothetical protein
MGTTMEFCTLWFFDAQFEQLESDWIRPRNERSILLMTGGATESRLAELEEAEAKAFSAMMNYRLRYRIAET